MNAQVSMHVTWARACVARGGGILLSSARVRAVLERCMHRQGIHRQGLQRSAAAEAWQPAGLCRRDARCVATIAMLQVASNTSNRLPGANRVSFMVISPVSRFCLALLKYTTCTASGMCSACGNAAHTMMLEAPAGPLQMQHARNVPCRREQHSKPNRGHLFARRLRARQLALPNAGCGACALL